MLRASFPASRFVFSLVLWCFALTIAGCGAPLNESQYKRLKLGMTPTQVDEILGKGKAVEAAEVDKLLKEALPDSANPAAPSNKLNLADFRGVRWGTEKKNITVLFQNDKLFRAFQQGL